MGEGQAKLKIDQIIEWIDKSDYYQILNIPKDANKEQCKLAYYKLSQQYHPDKYYSRVDKTVRDKITIVFKRVNEAYMVLKNPKKRARYDKLAFGSEREQNLRYQVSEEDRDGPANPEDQAKTPQGKKYFKLALMAQKRKDWKALEMNIKLALGFEADNEAFKKLKELANQEIFKEVKKDPFKIK